MKQLYFTIHILIITLVFGGNFYYTLPGNYQLIQNNEIHHLIGIMAEFQEELTDDPNTSGNGQFLLNPLVSMPEVFDRCDGFIADPPPHNAAYFSDQMLAVSNYFENVSNGKQEFLLPVLIDSVFTLPNSMSYYSQSEDNLTQSFLDAVTLAADSIEPHFTDSSIVVVFHAGIGQDFAVPFLDPTPYDLSSAFIDEDMLSSVEIPEEIIPFLPNGGILLPETQNHIFYDVIEDIFWGETDYCDYQIGITGTFALLLGYAIGLPPLYNTNTGDAGVGVFGLMDHGSNNGRGVLPAPPTPWTEILMGWDEAIQLTQDGNYTLDVSDILKIQMDEDEYFLIENRNNWIQFGADMDSLRFKNKIDDTRLGHWFDTFIDETNTSQVTISPETNVILTVDSYNYGLPGSGLLIWHITEPDPTNGLDSLNIYPDARAIHLEEADGAVDIGFPTTAIFADPTTGWRWDMWYADNPAYHEQNPNLDVIKFDNYSEPNTRTQEGAETFISISNISGADYEMQFTVSFTDNIETVLLQPDSVLIIGSSVKNDTGYVYYISGDLLYIHSDTALDSTGDFQAGQILLSTGNCDTLVTPSPDGLTYLDENCVVIDSSEFSPIGFVDELDNTIEIPEAQALGDIDLDGLDEIIFIDDDSSLVVKNGNESLNDGFPLNGKFYGVPLVANILDDLHPEIICRERDEIVIISYTGDREKNLSSIDPDQDIRLIPFWKPDTIALVDGNRLLMFPQDLEYSYWLNPNSRSSNYPLVTGPDKRTGLQQFIGIDENRTYNYPNPVMNSETTFRYFVGDANRVDITIFTVSGFKVDQLTNDEITQNEYNETKWDASNVNSGLYFAEVKPDIGDVALVRVVVIR